MIRFLVMYFLLGLTITGALWIGTERQQSLSFAIGAGIIWFNLIVLALVWHQILKKKLIALATLVIVFKYAILGAIIYQILQIPWISPGYFVGGLCSLVVGVLVYALTLREEKDGIQSNITDSWSR